MELHELLIQKTNKQINKQTKEQSWRGHFFHLAAQKNTWNWKP